MFAKPLHRRRPSLHLSPSPRWMWDPEGFSVQRLARYSNRWSVSQHGRRSLPRNPNLRRVQRAVRRMERLP